MCFRKVLPEAPQVGPTPFLLEVGEVAQHADDAWSGSDDGVGERDAVRSAAEPYLLLGRAFSVLRQSAIFASVCGRLFGEAGDESISSAVPCLGEARLPRIVVEGAAQFLDARRQRVVAHGSSVPDCREEVLLRDRLSSMPHELFQHGGRLWRQPDFVRTGPQATAVRL